MTKETSNDGVSLKLSGVTNNVEKYTLQSKNSNVCKEKEHDNNTLSNLYNKYYSDTNSVRYKDEKENSE